MIATLHLSAWTCLFWIFNINWPLVCIRFLLLGWRFIHIVAYIGISFLFKGNIPLHVLGWPGSLFGSMNFWANATCYHIYLFIHLLVDIWVVYIFWLLWIMLLWTFMCEYLFESLFSVLLGVYFGVELLGHVIILTFLFWGTAKLFSGNNWNILQFYQLCVRVLVLPHPHQHLLLSVYIFKLYPSSWIQSSVLTYGFDLLFLNYQWCWESFHLLLGHLYLFLEK